MRCGDAIKGERMNNYINIDTLRKNMMRLQEYEHKYLYTHEVFNEIWNMPIADVRENTRGDWLKGEDGVDWGYWRRCSICGHGQLEISNFCPECGANMKGKEIIESVRNKHTYYECKCN